ncbi:hypothetical protein AWJ20_611 [Sugiyamaella lignohabitans]|uniref:Macro domain-containing protein n=1 Tax=Sugiyamaella lignohabitans TaxID=796027 RepID=A0A167D1D7_9ASCO|nr:uncharacterized protein AWJ20_611 [Sugiyamaella lignohabitans]ANB12361.1 hypothetical protein AWJ20_611 [Sugiyamaella lignohabitans]
MASASGVLVKFLVYDRSGKVADSLRSLLPQVNRGTNQLTIDILPYSSDKDLAQVIRENSIDAIISPGNSYGFLNGGFDAAISSYYSGEVSGGNISITANDITLCLQDVLLEKMGGYNPVSHALVVNMSDALKSFPKTMEAAGQLKNSIPQLIHTPTMALPTVIPPGSRVIFDCMWNIICSIKQNNVVSETKINRVLLPGLGTGVGRVSADSCASQVVTALQYFNKAESAKSSDEYEKTYIDAANMDRDISKSAQ